MSKVGIINKKPGKYDHMKDMIKMIVIDNDKMTLEDVAKHVGINIVTSRDKAAFVHLMRKIDNEIKKDLKKYTLPKHIKRESDYNLAVPWTADVVYNAYCCDDLKTLPLPILLDMEKHLKNIINEVKIKEGNI